MPTPSGWLVALAAVLAVGIGRLFGIVELFVIGAGLAASVVWAVLAVRSRPPRIAVTRTLHPDRVTAGEPARAELVLHNGCRSRSVPVLVVEAVGGERSARMAIGALAAGDHIVAGYRIPTNERGRLQIGPTIAIRQDLLGLASTSRPVTGVQEVTVAPPTVVLPMPVVGSGLLGRQLATTARRLGPGEFHALRSYVPGDEIRSVDWKASARTEDLIVREHRTPALRRCVVVLDRFVETYADRSGPPGPNERIAAFELAVVIAASLVRSAALSGLVTRFETGGGIVLGGPDVVDRTLDTLATIELGPCLDDFRRDPADDLGVLVVVTSGPDAPIWTDVGRAAPPSLTKVGIFTRPVTTDGEQGDATMKSVAIGATTVEGFVRGWSRVVTASDPSPRRTAGDR